MSGKGYFIDTINPGRDNLYTADQICRMMEFLIDNIFAKFGGCLFRQVIGIPMGTNCAPLLANLFLYSYESEFLDNMIRGGHRKLARSFNLCYRYIDDLIVFTFIVLMVCIDSIQVFIYHEILSVFGLPNSILVNERGGHLSLALL